MRAILDFTSQFFCCQWLLPTPFISHCKGTKKSRNNQIFPKKKHLECHDCQTNVTGQTWLV